MFSSLVIAAKGLIVLAGAILLFCQLVNRDDAAWFGRKPLWLMLAFWVIGVLGYYPYVAYACLVASLPLLAKSRGEGAALFIIAIGAFPDAAINLRIGGVAIMTLDKWVCLSLSLLIVFLRDRRVGLPSGRYFDIPFLLLFALDLVQSRDLNFTSTVRGVLSSVLTMALPYYCFTRSISRLEDLRRVILSIGFIGFVLSIVGAVEARLHFLFYQYIQSALGTINMGALIYKMRGGVLRAVTSFGDATSFSLFLSVGMMAVIASRYSFRTTGRLVIAIGIIAVGIGLASSRNAIIAILISIFCFDVYRRRYTALSGKAMVLAMAYAVATLAAEFSPYVGSLMGKSGDTASTSEYRSMLLQRGIEEFHKHPYIGLNLSDLLKSMADMKQGEGIVDFVNGYLFFALTAGTPGLVALVLAFLLPAITMLRARRRLARSGVLLQRFGGLVFAVTATYLVTTVFTGFGGRSSTYFYLVLGLGSLIFSWRSIDPQLVIASGQIAPRRRGGLPLAPPPPAEPLPA